MNMLFGFLDMIVPLTMILISIAWKCKPPKKIDFDYGYRTSMSMKNPQYDLLHKRMRKRSYCGLDYYCWLLLYWLALLKALCGSRISTISHLD